MKRKTIEYLISAIVVFIFLGMGGTMDLKATRAEELHKREIIAAAKAQRAHDIKWKKLEDDSTYMTFPIQAYNK